MKKTCSKHQLARGAVFKLFACQQQQQSKQQPESRFSKKIMFQVIGFISQLLPSFMPLIAPGISKERVRGGCELYFKNASQLASSSPSHICSSKHTRTKVSYKNIYLCFCTPLITRLVFLVQGKSMSSNAVTSTVPYYMFVIGCGFLVFSNAMRNLRPLVDVEGNTAGIKVTPLIHVPVCLQQNHNALLA